MAEKIKNVMGVIADLFFWLIMFVCIAASIVVITSDGRSGFNYRLFGAVQSGSMEASGLYRGDIVFVDGGENYEVGDIIVFYRAPKTYSKDAKDVDLRQYSVWVHQIVDVDEDAKGRRTYLTKGTSNKMHDGYYVPEDFVLGKAKQLPSFMSDLVIFLTSAMGIFVCIVTPSAILFLLFTADFCREAIRVVDDSLEEEERAAKRYKKDPPPVRLVKEKARRKKRNADGTKRPLTAYPQTQNPQNGQNYGYYYGYPYYGYYGYQNLDQYGQQYSNAYGDSGIDNQTGSYGFPYPTYPYYGVNAYGGNPNSQLKGNVQTPKKRTRVRRK